MYDSFGYQICRKYRQKKRNYTYYPKKRFTDHHPFKKYNDFYSNAQDDLEHISNAQHYSNEKPFQNKNISTPDLNDNDKENTNILLNKGIVSENSYENLNTNQTSNFQDGPMKASSSTSLRNFTDDKDKQQLSLLDFSNEELEEAYYFPKKLKTIYNYVYNQLQFQYKTYLSSQNLNYSGQIQTYPMKKANSFPIKNQFIPTNSSENSPENRPPHCQNVTPFSLNEPAFSINEEKNNSNNGIFGINNIHIGNSLNSSYESEKEQEKKENTDILNVKIKIKKNEVLIFKLRRYDDMFKTVQMFCEINQLDNQYIKPLIINVIKALNGIYGIYNMKLDTKDVQILNLIKRHIN